MRQAELEREELRVKRAIEKQKEDGVGADGQELKSIEAPDATPKRRRWDVEEPERPNKAIEDISMEDGTIKRIGGGEWDDANTASLQDQVTILPKKKRSRWDETPVGTVSSSSAAPGETPKRSRWDQTPVGVSATPMTMSQYGMTPVIGLDQLIAGSGANMELDKRNRYLSDEELNSMLPTEGYEIVQAPPGYAPIRTPARKLQETPMANGSGGFMMQDEGNGGNGLASMGMDQELPTDIEGVGELAFFKTEDAQYFAKVSTIVFVSVFQMIVC